MAWKRDFYDDTQSYPHGFMTAGLINAFRTRFPPGGSHSGWIVGRRRLTPQEL